MTRHRPAILFLCSLLTLLNATTFVLHADDTKDSSPNSPTSENHLRLAGQAALVLERNCLHCHRGNSSTSRAKFDVRSVASMVQEGVLLPNDPGNSLVWELAHRGSMPPRAQGQLDRLTPADSQLLAEWISAGAPEFPQSQPRQFVSHEQTLQLIAADLKSLPDKATRARQRYFSIVESHNNRMISDASLAFLRAALSKTLNSLSWQREIVLPRPIDVTQTLFAVDIEKLGWARDHWLEVRNRYPYAIGYGNLSDRKLADLDQEIGYLTGRSEPLYLLRADWFIANALQPSLYHALMYEHSIPELAERQLDPKRPANPKRMSAADLERYLQVDLISDFQRGGDHAMRCGFTSSGVSGQNRLLERHKTKYGSYWKSYDFKADNRRSILTQFPLGPGFSGHPHPQLVFEHDGGEIIFSLPNGLQGYMLIDGLDQRIDAGPIEVVSDALKTSGTPAIVSAVSCIACHKHGLIDVPTDEVRLHARVFDKARDHVQRLYQPDEVIQQAISKDSQQFIVALDQTISPFLKVGEDRNRDIGDFPEPVFEVVRRYIHDELDLTVVAAELHEPTADRLKAKIESDEMLLRLGLGVLLKPDGRIKRAYWEGVHGGQSVMQLTAFALDYTTPRFSK